MKIKTFGSVDERSLDQLKRCMQAGDAEFGVLCADHHPGYSQPIGGGIAYEGYVSPSGVGYDIGCGNKAARTDLSRSDLDALGGVDKLMGEITRRISFGMGVPATEKIDHPVLDQIRNAEFRPQRKLAQTAANQLGTVGSGNHYVNLMEDEEGKVWVGVHFGSRGFGHKTASGFLALAQGLAFDARAQEGEMDSPPVLFEIDSELGRSYIAAMQLAGDYAYAGRDVVVDKVLEILGAESTHEVHNHHNFAWLEEHFGRTYWVIRKGCTPARPGQEGFVGGSMGDESVILEGVESDDAVDSLYSTVHGAGRVMSRTQAAGRVRRRKRWELHRPRLRPGLRGEGHLPGPSERADAQGLGRGADQAGHRRLAGGAGAPARAGHRPGRRRRGRGAGGLQAAAGGPRRARRLDPGQAPAAAARRGDGRSRRGRPLQGLGREPASVGFSFWAAANPLRRPRAYLPLRWAITEGTGRGHVLPQTCSRRRGARPRGCRRRQHRERRRVVVGVAVAGRRRRRTCGSLGPPIRASRSHGTPRGAPGTSGTACSAAPRAVSVSTRRRRR